MGSRGMSVAASGTTNSINGVETNSSGNLAAKSYTNLIDKIKQTGYEVDAASLRESRGQDDIIIFKGNKAYSVPYNKYSNGNVEALWNNKKSIKL